jgi:hypothetical protein
MRYMPPVRRKKRCRDAVCWSGWTDDGQAKHRITSRRDKTTASFEAFTSFACSLLAPSVESVGLLLDPSTE